MNTMQELLQFSLTLTAEAQKKILPHFNTRVAIDDKADGTPVTIADKGAEETMRGLIAKHYPDHGIMGEEFGNTPGKGQYRWILDPIDGTKSFIFGVPLFGTLVALEHTPSPGAAPRIELGVINFPALGRTVYASLGNGAFERDANSLDVQQLHVSKTATVDKALVLTSSLHNVTDPVNGAAVHRIVSKARYGRSWGDCFGYYLVASGKADAMIDTVLAFWDIAALVPIVLEAGGRITGIDGKPAPFGVKSGLATNGILHETLLNEFRTPQAKG